MYIYALRASSDYETVETTLVRALKPHATPAIVLAVDRTSTLLATGAADGSIKVWDISAGYVTHSFRGPSVLISALHFFEAAEESRQIKTPQRKRKARGALMRTAKKSRETPAPRQLVSGLRRAARTAGYGSGIYTSAPPSQI